jgi:hypothetical protein
MLAGAGSVFADGGARGTAFSKNPLGLCCLAICGVSFLLVFVPRIFRWDWRARYFGIGTLYLGGVALVGLIPWLCVVLYSTLSVWIRLSLLVGYTLPIIWWCRRIVLFYRHIFATDSLRNILYVEEDDAVYFLQRSDKWLIQKKFKFREIPSDRYFVIAMGLAFLSVPFMTPLTRLVGLPFPHIFLVIAGLPLILFSLAFSVHGYLVFYYWPRKIKAKTGKEVYVDMTAKPPANQGRK